jgi:pimeloyl-ACP methyl ester carboxylesterase
VRKLPLTCLCPLLTCCWVASSRPEAFGAEPPPAPPVGVAFVTNGSGGLATVSTALSQAAAETATPLRIETCVWSHGSGRYFIDHVNHANHLAHGRHLAARVMAYRQACRQHRIYLIGNSAGCAIVLAAAEMLPPESVERIILLAPSLCVAYDLRPALCTARSGIDVFHSSRDRVVLGMTTRIIGTADRCRGPAAGLHGFRPVITCSDDAALYSKLRQHPWHFDVAWSGNHGGHYGNHKPGFLRAYVLPLLVAD